MAYKQNQKILAKEINIYSGPSTARKLVGCATAGTLNITTNVTDARSKCSGNNPESIPVSYTWEVTATVQLLASGDNARVNFDDLVDVQTSLGLTHVAFKTGTNEVVGREGDAWITSTSLSGGTDDIATYDITFTGEGALTKIAVVTT